MNALEQVIIYRRGLNVTRMHTVPHIRHYDNGSHSASAALIALELCKLNEVSEGYQFDIIKYMLMHDIAEQFVGDVPADVKRIEPTIKEVLDKVEKSWERKNIPSKPESIGIFGSRICKCADLIELGMFCVEEINMGNRHVRHVLENVISYLGDHISKVKGSYQFLTYFQEVLLDGSK